MYKEELVDDQNVALPVPDLCVIEIRASLVKEATTFFKVLDDERYHYREGSSILPLKNVREVVTFRDRDERTVAQRKMGIYSSEVGMRAARNAQVLTCANGHPLILIY